MSDEIEGSVVAPEAEPLTEAALDRHDDVEGDHLDDVVAMLEFGTPLAAVMKQEHPSSVSAVAVRGEDVEDHPTEREVDVINEAGGVKVAPEDVEPPATPLPHEEDADKKRAPVLAHDTIDDIPDEE